MSINTKLEIVFNNNNKLAIQKKSLLNTKLRLLIDGNKNKESTNFNLKLSPAREVPVFTIEFVFCPLPNFTFTFYLRLLLSGASSTNSIKTLTMKSPSSKQNKQLLMSALVKSLNRPQALASARLLTGQHWNHWKV